MPQGQTPLPQLFSTVLIFMGVEAIEDRLRADSSQVSLDFPADQTVQTIEVSDDGGSGNQILNGGAGHDTLSGGDGSSSSADVGDVLTGVIQDKLFVFTADCPTSALHFQSKIKKTKIETPQCQN